MQQNSATKKTNQNEIEFQEAVKENNWDKATALLEKIISRPLSEKEKGQIYLNIGLAYTQLNNVISKKYDKVLETVLESLKKINKKEGELETKEKIEILKEELLT